MKHPRFKLGIGLVAVGGIGLLIYLKVAENRAIGSFAEAAREIDAGHMNSAREILLPLSERWPRWAEVRFQLGRCEAALGRAREALTAWEAIPETSPVAPIARLEQLRLEELQGALRKAETLAKSIMDRPGPTRADARRDLVRILRAQGRQAEALRSFDYGRAEARDLTSFYRERYQIVNEPPAVAGLRIYFDRLQSRPGADDRVLLGQANLALLTDRLADADLHLRQCESVDASDRPTLVARLRWSVASDRLDLAIPLLSRIRDSDLNDSDRVELGLWLTTKMGDPSLEQKALVQLSEILPDRAKILDRLAVVAARSHALNASSLREEKEQLEERREHLRSWMANSATPGGFDVRLLSRPEAVRAEAELFGLATVRYPSSQASQWVADLLSEIVKDITRDSTGSSRPRVVIPRYVDLASPSGLKFIHQNGAEEGARQRLIPPITSSGGVALLDYDQDGQLDIYAVQGGSFPPRVDLSKPGDRLFHNEGNGSFADVTERAGLGGVRGYGHGVTVGDIDNDGYPDLFVTRWNSYSLYRNRGDGTFEDITMKAGLSGDRDWPTSSAFADLDNDGDLDLYVCHYLRWDEQDPRPCVDKDDPTKYACSPRDFPALPDHLFRNDSGRFVDVSESAGIVDRDGRGLGVVAADLDGDGKIDLYVANDMSANLFFRNLGGLRFEEVALAAGAAANSSGGYQAGMGVACGDLDGDGLPDLAVTNFYNECTSFFLNLGQGRFGDQTASIGLAGPSRFMLGFGICFLDANNDGLLDLMTANGHVHDGRPRFPWKMPLQLLVREPSGRLLDVSKEAGEPFSIPRLGRGLAVGDLDNDGRSDAVVISQNGPLSYLHNETSPYGDSITILLEGKSSNRDAVGAIATLKAGQRAAVRHRVGGGSYQSSSDPRLHFGLGGPEKPESIEVRWPSGRVDLVREIRPGFYRLIEGKAQLKPVSPRPLSATHR